MSKDVYLEIMVQPFSLWLNKRSRHNAKPLIIYSKSAQIQIKKDFIVI